MVEPITKFDGEYRFLSNFFRCSIIGGPGVLYTSTEAAYQAGKATNESDRLAIQNTTTPGQAKRLGRKIRIKPDWNQIKDPWMECLVRLKFSDIQLGQMLLNTGDALLIEGNSWHDRYWGAEWENGAWVGENKLGKILMKVREELRRKE